MIKFGGKSPLFASLGGYKKIPQTFTRASDAYLDGVLYGPNTPRFPSNSGTRGVIVEEGATNLALRSQEFDNAYWLKTRASVTADAATAPDGTQTADKLVEDATATATHNVIRTGVLTAGVAGVISVYAKAAERSKICITPTSGISDYVIFDLSTGTIVSTIGAAVGTITQVGNGWYRCTVAMASIVSGWFSVFLCNAANAVTYSGDGVSGVYLWGAQAEAKGYPTTYIPTTSATVTRAAETLTVPTAGLLVPSQGSVIIKTLVTDYHKSSSSDTAGLFNIATAGTQNQISIRSSAGANVFGFTRDAASVASTTALVMPAVGWHVFGLSWSSAAILLGIDGATASTAATHLPADLGATVSLGKSSKEWNAPLAYAYFYSRALTGAEMAAATLGNLPPDFTAHLDYTHGTLGNLTFNTNPTYDPDLFESRDVTGLVFG